MTFFRSDTITVDAALRDIRSGDARTRAAAAAALGDVDPEHRDQAVGALVPALSDPSPDIRAAAASSLGELGGPRAVNQLVLCLDDQIAIVRQTAAIALGKIGDAEAFEPLAIALREGPPDLRFQAATSLAEIDPGRALEPLLAALADADAEVLGAIALALGAVGDAQAGERLVPLLDHARELTRFDAAYALARLGDPRAVPVLSSLARRPELSWDAIESLELLGAGAAADALAALLADTKLARAAQIHAAAALIAAAPEHPSAAMARAQLCAAVGLWWKPDARALAVQQLGRVGGTWAERALHAVRGRWTARGMTDEIDDALRRIRRRIAPESA